MRANYHTHCDFCDGRASAAAMASRAAEAGYRILGFSSHAPLPHRTEWALPPERLQEYAAEIRRLKTAWAPGGEESRRAGRELEILLGLEIDWLPGLRAPGDGAFDSLALDYKLGSTHYVRIGEEEPWTVDCGEASFAERVAAAAGGKAAKVWKAYYAALGDLIDAGGFDILGHFDLVKKNNTGGRYFDEEDPAYLAAAFEAVDRLRGKDVVVEINVGGMARGKTREPYPSLPILREIRKAGARITLCADAHDTAHLGVHLEAGKELARAAGYESFAVLTGGRWIEVGLEEA